VNPARGEQELPPPRHRDDGQEHDDDRGQEVAPVRVAEDLDRLAEVDLPDQVRRGEAGDGERRDQAQDALVHETSVA
jgi:hypothetical protein